MTLTPTGLQMDWTGVVYATIALNEIKDCTPADGGTFERYYADAAKYPKAGRVVNKTSTVKITSGNVTLLRSLPRDTPSTLTFTHNDYLNGAVTGGGALIYTMINAVLIAVDDGGGNNQFGTATATFEALSTDGTTSPLSSAPA